MRIGILWAQMSGYFDACLRALDDQGHAVALIDRTASGEAPYQVPLGATAQERLTWTEHLDVSQTAALLHSFQIDALLICSWHVPEYRRLAKAFSGRALRLLCMDNWWRGSARQWAGRLSSPLYLRPYFDMAFLPGIRQAQFARMLGFDPAEIITGLYCADTVAFSSVENAVRTPTFLYAGRLVAEKGLPELIAAYKSYRKSSIAPWTLSVAGTGPLAPILDGVKGVEQLGFVQPTDLPPLMSSTTVFYLPSHHEHWGVAVHEAAAAGMVLCTTSEVAAADRFVQEGYNGIVLPPGDREAIEASMHELSTLPPARLREMSLASRSLARQLTTEQWARHLVFRLQQRR